MIRNGSSFTTHATILFKQKWEFLYLFLLMFFLSFLILFLIGFVPEYTPTSAHTPVTSAYAETSEVVQHGELGEPVRITIPKVGIDARVENPESRDIEVLDRALSRGAVHYPGTGTLEEDANIFLFGHSSFLPNVINKNYQTFNNLGKLAYRDEIFVDSENTRYVYRVTSVTLAEADEIKVDIRRGVRKLTLSTCNSFGAESERYVVEADYAGSYVLAI